MARSHSVVHLKLSSKPSNKWDSLHKANSSSLHPKQFNTSQTYLSPVFSQTPQPSPLTYSVSNPSLNFNKCRHVKPCYHLVGLIPIHKCRAVYHHPRSSKWADSPLNSHSLCKCSHLSSSSSSTHSARITHLLHNNNSSNQFLVNRVSNRCLVSNPNPNHSSIKL